VADSKTRRVADTLRGRIADGTYPAGGSLPGAAQIADELNVSVGTARTALLALDDEGLTVSRQGRTRIVTASGDSSATRAEQVATSLRMAIVAGTHSAGETLPSEIELANLHDVSRHTIQSALKELEASGEVITRPGRRRVVAGGSGTSDALYEQVALKLRAAIKQGRHKVGEPLPSEERLTQEYGTSRTTIRDALALLREDGVVESVPRIGSIVRKSE
jgi:DNA-binding GntR family transcriptional regulator